LLRLRLDAQKVEEELGGKIPLIDLSMNDVYVTEDNRVLRMWRDKDRGLRSSRIINNISMRS